MPTSKLESYRRAVAAAKRAQKKVAVLRTELAVNCPHPEEFIKPYKWEHDNGYGRQSSMVGKICNICHGLDLWGHGSFSKPKDLDY